MLDEPTDLPEGTLVELAPVEATDGLDPGERARLLAFVEASIRSHVPGAGIDAQVLLDELRAGR